MKRFLSKHWWYFLIAFCLIIWIYQFSDFDSADFNKFQAVYSISKDVITGALAIISIKIAFEGLSIWNRQIKGKHHYNLAFQAILIIKEIKRLIKIISGNWKVENAFSINAETIPLIDKYPNLVISPITFSFSPEYKSNIDELINLRFRLIEIQKESEIIWERNISKSLQNCISECHFFEVGVSFITYHLIKDRDFSLDLEKMDIYEIRRNITLLFKYWDVTIAYKKQGKFKIIKSFSETEEKINKAFDPCINLLQEKIEKG